MHAHDNHFPNGNHRWLFFSVLGVGATSGRTVGVRPETCFRDGRFAGQADGVPIASDPVSFGHSVAWAFPTRVLSLSSCLFPS